MKHDIKFLEKCYLSVVSDKNCLKSCFNDREFPPLCIENQARILDASINHPLCKTYSPPLSYQEFFLRIVLDAVEEGGYEFSDDLVEAYINSLGTLSKSDFFFRTYLISDDCSVTLQESSCFVINSTTGLQTWEASKYLLEWFMENSQAFKNRTILELGSGIGLLGITVVKICQPRKYIFTDKSLDVLNILSNNIDLNIPRDIADQVILKKQLFWQDICSEVVLQLQADFIFGADIGYDPSSFKDLITALKMFFQGGTKCAYIANTIRCADTNHYFLTLLKETGLKHEIVEFKPENIFIFKEPANFVLYKLFLN